MFDTGSTGFMIVCAMLVLLIPCRRRFRKDCRRLGLSGYSTRFSMMKSSMTKPLPMSVSTASMVSNPLPR